MSASAGVDLGFDFADPETYWPTAKKILLWAVGAGSPYEQLAGVIALSVIFIASSVFTLGWTLTLLVLVSLPLGAMAVLRIAYSTVAG
jgi:uncharacterized membrane protein